VPSDTHISLKNAQPASDATPAALAAPPTEQPVKQGWQPPSANVRPFPRAVEQWRPMARQLIGEAWDEGRLTGNAAQLDDDLVLSVIQQESEGDPDAQSFAGAYGLMQVMPQTYAEMMLGSKSKVSVVTRDMLFDVPSNMRAGVRYLALGLQRENGNLYWTVASYNAGVDVVDEFRTAGLYAVPPIGGYTETAAYAQIVLKSYLSRRPDVQMHVPDPMPLAHVAGAIRLLHW
jgi:soluble lytic murein transglycosylase-like protein